MVLRDLLNFGIQLFLKNNNNIKYCFEKSSNVETFKTFEPNSRQTYELQELTTDCAYQLRSSRTEYDSATNPNICQFVSIRGIRGLCGIGVLNGGWADEMM